MFARALTSLGVIECSAPWRARKATTAPEGSEANVIGDDGLPQG